MRTTKDWKLPVPEETEDGFDWQPVVRVGRTVPFGYEQDPEDKDILLLNDSDLMNKEPPEEGRRIASPPPEKVGSNFDNLSDNEKRMNISPKSGSE